MSLRFEYLIVSPNDPSPVKEDRLQIKLGYHKSQTGVLIEFINH